MAVYLDDGFFDHRKSLEAGEDACLLYIQGLAFAARNDTRGVIRTAALPRLTTKRNVVKLAGNLVRAGLWDTIPGGWRIHDYEERNAAQIARREKARKASIARWHPEQSPEDAPSIPTRNAPPCSSNAIPQPQSSVDNSSSYLRGSPQAVDDDGENKRLWKIAKTQLLERRAKPGLPPIVNEEAWLVEAMTRLRKNPPPPEARSVVTWFKGCEPNHANTTT